MSKVARRARDEKAVDEEAVDKAIPTSPLAGVAADLERLSSDELAGDLARSWQPPVAVAGDARAEAEADRVADATARRLDDGADRPVVDGALSPQLRGAMRLAAPDLEGLDEVRVDTGATAAATADAIGARAFAHGRDVSVASGELGRPDAAHLVAHEAAHAVQQGRESSEDGTPLVHAKLRGTKDALVSMGGEKTTKGAWKLIKAKTNWDKILDGLGAYEALETALLAGGKNPEMSAVGAAKPKMLKVLKGIQSDIRAWQKANGQDKAEKLSEKWEKNAKEGKDIQESDDRDKAERRQAIAMLVPRVNTEIGNLESPGAKAWLDSLGLAPQLMTAKGKEDSGQKNTVQEMTYQTESGEFSGYFKAEKGFAGDQEAQEAEVGIRQVDPNYGARSIAMYRIDKLLGADVTARAEFATHVDKSGKTILGTVLESAKGKRPGDTKIVMTSEEAKGIPGAVAMDDPVLQSSLSKLGILDAICGQLDRHAGNYYIQTDESGRVTGVTGIDLDMAFGKDQKTGDVSSAKMAMNFKGLPAQIDAEFGRRLLRISPNDIESALKGLLSDAEVAATVARFTWVCDKIRELDSSKQLVEKWDAQTALNNKVQTFSDTKWQSNVKSYNDNLAGMSADGVKADVGAALQDAILNKMGPKTFRPGLMDFLDDEPDQTKAAMVGALKSELLRDAVAMYAFDKRIGDMAVDLLGHVLNALLSDRAFWNKASVESQEGTLDRGSFTTSVARAAGALGDTAFARLPKRA